MSKQEVTAVKGNYLRNRCVELPWYVEIQQDGGGLRCDMSLEPGGGLAEALRFLTERAGGPRGATIRPEPEAESGMDAVIDRVRVVDVDPFEHKGFPIEVCDDDDQKAAWRQRSLNWPTFCRKVFAEEESASARNGTPRSELEDLAKQVYVVAFRVGQEEPCGLFRLRLDFDVTSFGGLDAEIHAFDTTDCRLADVGAYLGDLPRSTALVLSQA